MTGDLAAALILNLLLPWAVGFALARRLLPAGPPPTQLLHAAYAYPLGIIVVATLPVIFDLLGLPFHRLAMASVAIALAFAFTYPWRPRVSTAGLIATADGVTSTLLTTLLTAALVPLLLAALMVVVIVASPTESWDSWMNWEPRARIWFTHNELLPFVLPGEWLARTPHETVYALGNKFATTHPPLIPLVMLWEMLMLQDPDSPALYLAWPAIALSTAIAIGVHLRLQGTSWLALPLAMLLFLGIPYVGMHIAMPGYADLPLACFFCLGILIVQRWQTNGGAGQLLAFALLTTAVFFSKRQGLIIAPIMIATLVLAFLPAIMQTLLRRMIAAGGAVLVLLTCLPFVASWFGVQFPAGEIVIPTPAVQEVHLGIYPFLPILAKSVFDTLNWGPFWLLVILVVATMRRSAPATGSVGDALLMTSILLFAGFSFTSYYNGAEEGVTLYRALLYLVPLGVCLVTERLLRSLPAASAPPPPQQ